MKKLVAFAAVIAAVSFTSCGNKSAQPAEATAQTETVVEEVIPAAAEDTATTTEEVAPAAADTTATEVPAETPAAE